MLQNATSPAFSETAGAVKGLTTAAATATIVVAESIAVAATAAANENEDQDDPETTVITEAHTFHLLSSNISSVCSESGVSRILPWCCFVPQKEFGACYRTRKI